MLKIIFILTILSTLMSGCGENQETEKPRTILIAVNGLASGSIDRALMAHLQSWKKESCYYKEVSVPIPVWPSRSNGYSWNCPVTDPVLMTGTVFIGQEGIRDRMIQHLFGDRKSAFIVNGDSYDDISKDFTFYYNLKKKETDIYSDELVFYKAREIIKNDNPGFICMHLEGTGAAAFSCSLDKNKDEDWYRNIWQEESPYIQQLRKDDQLIEEFINWLQYEGYWESTTLFFAGNKGEPATGELSPYNPESCKTEMMILGKNVRAGAKLDYAELTDIAPTISRINNQAPTGHTDGRVLEEAFIWGPDSFKPDKRMERLDQILTARRDALKPATGINRGFMTIERICEWHTAISPVNLDEFIRYEEKIQ